MDTATRLIDLAEAAMRSRGFGGFSYGDIARAAGIRKASIHHHFPSKADLGLAALDRYADRLARDLEQIARSHRLGGQALLAAIAHFREAIGDGDRLCLCAALAADMHALDSRMAAKLERANRMTLDWLAAILVEGRRDRSIAVGGDPAKEAAAILAQLQGAQLLARAARDPRAFDDAMEMLVARITRR